MDLRKIHNSITTQKFSLSLKKKKKVARNNIFITTGIFFNTKLFRDAVVALKNSEKILNFTSLEKTAIVILAKS